MSKLKSPVVAAIASAALTATVVGGVAIAQTSGVITACVAENSGNVRIVSSTENCKPNEAATTWNQKGEPGTDGTNGVSGRVEVQGPATAVAPGGYANAYAVCPSGTLVMGGGHLWGGDDVALTVRLSIPETDRWHVWAKNNSTTATYIYAYAVCAASS